MIGKYRVGIGFGVALVVAIAAWLYWQPILTSSSSESVLSATQIVQSRECDFVSRYGFRVDCYWVSVGEGGVQARLAAAIFRAADENAPADPLVYLAGGPGETGNTDASGLSVWDLWLAETALKRDFVLLDLRGLSPSEPVWDCVDYTKTSRELLNQNLTFAQEGEIIEPVLEACLSQWRENLARQHGPVAEISDFSSQLNAADLGISLRSLGYDQWNYLAVSYGTRVALLAAMQQPEVRRVILDSPYPLERGSISDSVTLWVEAFARYWRWCAAQSCEFTEPQFWQLMADLRQEPVWVEMENWRTGGTEQWLLNDGRLAAVLYTAFYSSELTNRLALALRHYVSGDGRELNKILEIFFNQAFDSHFNSAMYWATECNDNPLEDEEAFARTLMESGLWRPFFAADWQYNVCRSEVFRPGQLPLMKLLPVPFLVAAGELDPITTAAHAREVMTWLPNGYLLVQEGRSHAEFFMGECGQDLIPWFLQATPEQLVLEWSERSAACRSMGVEAGDGG